MFWPVWMSVAVAALSIVIVLLCVLSKLITPKPLKLKGLHVLITGGSSGIGKCLAVEAAKRGASVTLVARNEARLQDAKTDVEKNVVDSKQQTVCCFSVDITGDFGKLQTAVKQIEEQQGPITILINCAGSSSSSKFLETPVDEFKRLMDVNYHASVLLTRAVVPSLMRQKQGRVVFVSSMAGQLGLFGYTAYSPSKFALRGLAESLQMELLPYNIQVTLAFPPDTDTPGYAEEQKSKPKETQLISEAGGLWKPEAVAHKILEDSRRGHFLSSFGIDGFMLSTVSSGFAPFSSLCELLMQAFLMGLFRLVSMGYLAYFNHIVRRCYKEGEEADKKSS